MPTCVASSAEAITIASGGASNTAADHLAVLGMALAALPKPAPEAQPILVRCDSAGATHALVEETVGRRLHFSVGFDLTEPVRQAILALPESTWQPALDPDGHPAAARGSQSYRAWT